MNTLTTKKGFTLIELLIVIAIIAILATAVILLLNPAALLAQARDSQRISDLDTLKSAISLYLSTVTNASLTGGNGNCYVYTGAPVTAGCGGRHTAATAVAGTTRGVNAAPTDWLPVNFGAIPGGSPLSVLPIDSRNGATYYYSYVGNTNGTFEIDAHMESARYANGGSDDAESTDGGNNANVREVGNAPGLAL